MSGLVATVLPPKEGFSPNAVGAIGLLVHRLARSAGGEVVGRQVDAPFTDVPFFWSAQYEQAFYYDGHAQDFDPPTVDGSLADYDATVRYEKDGKLLAVVTLDRDIESLKAEMAFEKTSPAP